MADPSDKQPPEDMEPRPDPDIPGNPFNDPCISDEHDEAYMRWARSAGLIKPTVIPKLPDDVLQALEELKARRGWA